MNTYPADEQRISEVERGWTSKAVIPLPPGELLAVGDAILFALALSLPGQEPNFVRGGDSVRVVLTSVTDLEEADPKTGQALFQLTWDPLGQPGPPLGISTRSARPRSLPRRV